MADDKVDGPNGQARSHARNRPTPLSPSASTKNDSTATFPRSKSPIPHTESSSIKAIPLDSQPMTKTSSSSSLPSAHGANATDTNGPSPYGTRSRNRTGNARPNYAEDHEVDVEYDWSSTKKSQALGTSAAMGLAQVGESEKPIGVSTRRSSNAALGTAAGKAAPTNTPRDHIPGMSSFSLNADSSNAAAPPPPSKKRKAPGGSHVSSSASPALGYSTSNGHPRRATAAASSNTCRQTNMLSFENCQGYLKNGRLKADDGTTLSINDHVYLICEPPGEPYYLARIMEFLHSKNSQGSKNDHHLPIEFLRVNWYYRPRDIQRKVNDTRVVFASMHSDTCPLTSLRGKCQIFHRNDIVDLDEYRKTKDCFWYEKMFDRYIHRYYEVIPTSQVINVPARVKKVLDERWKFVIVEMGRGKELTSAIKTCKRCVGYCAINDSVDCAMCKNTYHMNCVRPALQKKPARGFAWSCGPCSRKQERKLEARNTPLVGERALEGDDEELFDEEEDDHGGLLNPTNGNNSHDLSTQSSGPRPATAEQIAQAKLWPYRYLGLHCRVEDALDYDDRIYPRASSRLGPKHQANVHVWHGRPIELVKPADIRKKYVKGGSHKKDAKLTKETIAAMEADKMTREKRPKWVMDEPVGYVRRGDNHPDGDPLTTAKLQFRLPQLGEISPRGNDPSEPFEKLGKREKFVDDYMTKAKALAKSVGVPEYSTNFLDKALELLQVNNYAIEPALQQLRNVNKRKDLKEPELNKEELKRFEDGVLRYGSELRNVSRHVGKSQKYGEIVRFYYMWKKTEAGKRIWGHYEGRKGKKQPKQADSKLVDDVADDIDDSAFDNGKAAVRKRGFECKFCAAKKSPQWRRAPATAPGTTVPSDSSSKNNKDKGGYLMVALCQRCAGLWRRYGIQWENIDEVAKKVANGGGRAWKRRIDEELLSELFSANEASSMGVSSAAAAAAASAGVEVPSGLTIQDGPKKKQKTTNENPAPPAPQIPAYSEPPPPKKKVEKPPEPPLIPESPRLKILPCAVCYQMEPLGDQHFSCRYCRLTVHRNCYGIAEGRSGSKWTCDTCSNDSACQISTSYECVLCPITRTEQELMEPPKISHKKKSEREREKETLEREMINDAINLHHRKQIEQGRPFEPREPLKRTAGNNWVHVVCALWNPEIRLGNAKLLDSVEGIPSIAPIRYEQLCKLCKTSKGVCISCHQCAALFHVGCAQQHGYSLGFNVTPVKGSRKDAPTTVTLGGETGTLSAVAYCREHSVKSMHAMYEIVEDSSLNALQLFARNFKQADLTMTGTVRKAALIHSSARAVANVTIPPVAHRSSTSTMNSVSTGNSVSGPSTRSSRVSPAAITVKSEEVDGDGDWVVRLSETTVTEPSAKDCTLCGTDTSPKWHKANPQIIEDPPSPLDPPRVDLTEAQQRASTQAPHSQVNGDVSFKPDDLASRLSASQPAVTSTAQGVSEEASSGTLAPMADVIEIRTTTELRTDPPAAQLTSPGYLCHRCHLKKLRDPTPPRSPTPKPDPVQVEAPEIPQVESPPPLAPPVWPTVPAIPTHDPYHGWSNQPPPPHYNGRPRMSNGVCRSPPAVVVPLQPHFISPSASYHAAGYGHSQHHEASMQHLVNGAPSPYSMPRNHNSHMVSAPYPQHHSHPPHPSHATHPHPPHTARLHHVPPPTIRSPTLHDQNTQGPHGPPRAAENPFVIPYQSHSPPRQLYQGIYGSPRGNFERPETPPDGLGRNGGWPPNDGQMTNGASANPSLRNLLH